MTDQNPEQTRPAGNSETDRHACRRRGRGRFRYIFVGFLIAIVGAGAFAVHKHRSAWHGGDRFSNFVEHRLDKTLEELDATFDQKAKVKPVLRQASEDLRKVFLDMRNNRDAYMLALLSSKIDREKVEKLRAEQFAAMDQASQRVARAITDAAEVLTPMQRGRLATKIERRHRWHW